MQITQFIQSPPPQPPPPPPQIKGLSRCRSRDALRRDERREGCLRTRALKGRTRWWPGRGGGGGGSSGGRTEETREGRGAFRVFGNEARRARSPEDERRERISTRRGEGRSSIGEYEGEFGLRGVEGWNLFIGGV
ncbi:uncharacterized protein A4U43_C01F21640 [Asparagus officinalis]|uniref:Uncharacterized protein n=1 Tax=Asparagus officinalis TaxID=4686 RepID=A0A5P1FVI7_ASPOF|nr:uncharacterized protein A4U43_C01F21640 [Asparagus officinalis]